MQAFSGCTHPPPPSKASFQVTFGRCFWSLALRRKPTGSQCNRTEGHSPGVGQGSGVGMTTRRLKAAPGRSWTRSIHPLGPERDSLVNVPKKEPGYSSTLQTTPSSRIRVGRDDVLGSHPVLWLTSVRESANQWYKAGDGGSHLVT